MMTLFIKSYFSLLLSTCLGILILFLAGLFAILQKLSPPEEKPDKKVADNLISPPDLCAIAGDDKIATQLDLARAYLETNHKSLAKQLLTSILLQGNYEQQKEAKR